MSKSLISTGVNPNDGNGDTLLDGATKVNSNFNEIYSSLGNGSDLNIGVGKTIISTDEFGNVGIGTISSSEKLQVQGNILVTGTSTFQSTSISNLTGTAGTITTFNSTSATISNLSGTSLSYSGISTFLTGPVLISSTGTATSTGTALQPLQVTGGGYVSGSFGIGTAIPSSKLQVSGDVLVSGALTATTFTGSLTGNSSSATYATSAGISTYATSAGISTYATSAGISTYATSAGISSTLDANSNVNTSGIITATGGFISVGSTTPIQISLVGDVLTFTAAGIGSTSLTLY